MMNPPAAAVLPASRSVQVGAPATAFATMINTGNGMASGCGVALVDPGQGGFMYQTTDPSTNHPVGAPNVPAAMAAGGMQTFVVSFTPHVPMDPTDIALDFRCTNMPPAGIHAGLNTMLVSASVTPVPDMVALAVTMSGDGIVDIPGPDGTGAFAVATVNMGIGGAITVSADSGGPPLPVTSWVCHTSPDTGLCVTALTRSMTVQVDPGATPTFAVFVAGRGTVPFAPAAHRVVVRFTDASGVVRGMTSVAVRTR